MSATEFISGIGIGLFGAWALGRSSLGARWPLSLLRQHGSVGSNSDDAAQQQALMKDSIAELKREDPEFATLIEQAPMSPVENQPPELTPPEPENRQVEVTFDEAREKVKEFSKDEDVADLFAALVAWKLPKRETLTENEYERSFNHFLTKTPFKGCVSQQQKVSWNAENDEGGGSGTARPDMIIRDRILVELKGGMSTPAETDRALGQMLRYLIAWKRKGPAVLTICGRTSPSAKFLIRTHVQIWRKTLRLPVTVYFKHQDEPPSDATFFPQV